MNQNLPSAKLTFSSDCCTCTRSFLSRFTGIASAPRPLIRPLSLMLLAGMISAGNAEEVSIDVPNGGFEEEGNSGKIGGSGLFGLAGADVSNALIGAGPWRASTHGILGLISPPVVNISPNGLQNGYCRITGLAGLKLLGLPLLNTRAAVTQTLSTPVESWTVYLLEADVDRSVVLSVAALAGEGVGISLAVNGTDVISSLTAPAESLSIQLLSATKYRLSVKYITQEDAPQGNLGIRLFTGEGTGLIHTGLLPEVVFDNIRLTASKLEA